MSYEGYELFFESSDSKNKIHAQIYEPVGVEIVGVLQISHGMIDHIGRYKLLVEALTARGYVVAGNDHLGHGGSVSSDSEYGYFAKRDGYSLVIDDLYKMNKILRERYPELPLVLMGHSMGSFLARLYAVRYPDTVDGLIIHGTGGKNPLLPMGKLVVSVLKALRGDHHRSKFVRSLAEGGYNKSFDSSEGEGAWLTRDGDTVADRPNDKRTSFVFTVSGYYDLFTMVSKSNSRDWYERYPKKLKTLVISGECDPVGNFGEGVREVYDGLSAKGCTVDVLLYEGARHELFNETCRDEVFSDLCDFLSVCGR